MAEDVPYRTRRGRRFKGKLHKKDRRVCREVLKKIPGGDNLRVIIFRK
jgi:hypothetical protein